MKKKLVSLGLVLASVFLLIGFVAPSFVSAQTTVTSDCASIPDANTLNLLLCRIAVLINSVIPVLISLGVVYFIWGVIQYAIARDEEAKTEGRGAMISGLIALLVIVSIWGLVNFMKNFIGIGDVNTINVPCVKSPGVNCPQ